MHIRNVAVTLCYLTFAASTPSLAQNLPKECREAMDVRSPQAQVELFTRCLDTGRLSWNDKATTFKQRAVAYMHLGQHQRAVDDINQGIKLKPEDADNYYLRSVAYRALGQHQRAVADCDRALGLEPDFAAALGNRAFAHKALGNIGQAKADAQRARHLDPTVKVPTF
ncbi:MAG: hypothetical protein KKA55_03455 [Proteobacteria bacterium]|nr:hypothetical protein [Pseudomonadota bacterium]MBU1594569.1 hypothetical protein [Pseudomonadota bacterium]